MTTSGNFIPCERRTYKANFGFARNSLWGIPAEGVPHKNDLGVSSILGQSCVFCFFTPICFCAFWRSPPRGSVSP